MIAHPTVAVDDLQTIVPVVTRKALDWLTSRLDRFDPFSDGAEEMDADIFGMKAMGELTFLVVHCLRLDVMAVRPWLDRFTAHLFAIAERRDLVMSITNNQFLILVGTMLEELAAETSHTNRQFMPLIQSILDIPYVQGIERPPFRTMDLRYSLDRVHASHQLPSLMELYKATLLAHNPQLPALDSSDIYSITHTIFYLTDMGQSLPGDLDPAELSHIRWVNRTLLGMYVRSSDLDILGELIMCQYQLQDPPTAATTAAWQRLFHGQDSSGFVPSPTFSRKKLRTLQGAAAETYLFKNSYHTTLVAAMAGVLWLRAYAPDHTTL